MERGIIKAKGHRVRRGIQGEEAIEGKFLRVCGNSGGAVLEGAHGEVSYQKRTADKGGVNWGRGASYLCGFLHLGAEDG